jgi:hypothetical protein
MVFNQSIHAFLASSQLTTGIHLPSCCTVHVFVVIHFCDSMWSFYVKTNLCGFFFIVCLYMYCRRRSSYEEGEVWGPIYRFILATFLCLSLDLQRHMSWYYFVFS